MACLVANHNDCSGGCKNGKMEMRFWGGKIKWVRMKLGAGVRNDVFLVDAMDYNSFHALKHGCLTHLSSFLSYWRDACSQLTVRLPVRNATRLIGSQNKSCHILSLQTACWGFSVVSHYFDFLLLHLFISCLSLSMCILVNFFHTLPECVSIVIEDSYINGTPPPYSRWRT